MDCAAPPARRRTARRPPLALAACLLGLASLAGAQSHADPGAAVNQHARVLHSLNGRWEAVCIEAPRVAEESFLSGTGPAWRQAFGVRVPGALQSEGRGAQHEGLAFYRLALPAVPDPPGGRLLLQFDGVAWRADVFLDGERLGRHDGPGRFRFDLTGKLGTAGRMLVVRNLDPGDRLLDNLSVSALPDTRGSEDFRVSGLVGAVTLLAVPPVEILAHELESGGDAPQLRLELQSHLDSAVELQAFVHLPAQAAQELPAATATLSLLPGQRETLRVPLPAAAELPAWTPEQPQFHALHLTLQHGDGAPGAAGATTVLRVARRDLRLEAGRLLVAGAPRRLAGVTYPLLFPRSLCVPPTTEFLRTELEAIRAAGFDLLRVEGPPPRELLALCDELGLFVLAEAGLGRIDLVRAETATALAAALTALTDAVLGHPSVAFVAPLGRHPGAVATDSAALVAALAARLPDRFVLGADAGRAPYGVEALPMEVLAVEARWPELPAWPALAPDAPQPALRAVTSWSAGGLPAYRENLAGYRNAMGSADAALAVQGLGQFAAQFEETAPARHVAGSAARLRATAEADSARALSTVGAALRADESLVFDCYALWRDVPGREGPGLVSAWGQPKPALAAATRLNRTGRGAGPPTEAAWMPRAVRPIAAATLVDLPTAVAEALSELVPREGPEVDGLARIVIASGSALSWTESNLPRAVTLLRWVRDGGTLLLLGSPSGDSGLGQDLFGSAGCGQSADLPLDVELRDARRTQPAWHVLAAPNSRLLDDIPGVGGALDERFGALLPDRLIVAPDGVPMLSAFDARGLYLGSAVIALTYGQGRLLISLLHFAPEALAETADDPLPRRLLENLVRLTVHAAGSKPAPAGRDVTPPLELHADLARGIQRYRLWFELAERLSAPRWPGRHLPRRAPAEALQLVRRKSVALDLIVNGQARDAAPLLAQIERDGLLDRLEPFLRAELDLSALLPGLKACDRDSALAAHARAALLVRDGHVDAGVTQIEQVLATLGASAPR